MTPLTVPVSPGTHVLQLRVGSGRAAGHPADRSAPACRQRSTSSCRACRRPACSKSAASPSAARVTIDGQARGSTPLTLRDVTPGDYQVVTRASRAGSRRRSCGWSRARSLNWSCRSGKLRARDAVAHGVESCCFPEVRRWRERSTSVPARRWPCAGPAAAQGKALAEALDRMHASVARNVVEAAEKMPEAELRVSAHQGRADLRAASSATSPTPSSATAPASRARAIRTSRTSRRSSARPRWSPVSRPPWPTVTRSTRCRPTPLCPR